MQASGPSVGSSRNSRSHTLAPSTSTRATAPALGASLLVVPKVRDEQQIRPRRDRERRRPAEPRQVADVGARRHEQRVQLRRLERPDERLVAGTPRVSAHDGTRDGERCPRVPGDSCPAPNPVTTPTATSASSERCRSGSRAKMFDRWTSTNGTFTASSASRTARLVCVNAAALMTAPSALPPETLDRLHELAFVIGLGPAAVDAERPRALARGRSIS